MAEIKKVRVKLVTRQFVDGVECEAGDIVLLDPKIAESFGEVLGEAKPSEPKKADK